MTPEVKTVVIEYSPRTKRVMVRGVFERDCARIKPLEEDNQQNYVQCFYGMDMGANVGFRFADDPATQHKEEQ